MECTQEAYEYHVAIRRVQSTSYRGGRHGTLTAVQTVKIIFAKTKSVMTMQKHFRMQWALPQRTIQRLTQQFQEMVWSDNVLMLLSTLMLSRVLLQ
jgi:hypothetical protein